MSIQSMQIIVCKFKYHISQTRMNFYTGIYTHYNTLKINHLYKIGQRRKDENGF